MTICSQIAKFPDPDTALATAIKAARAAGMHALRNMRRRSEALFRARHDVKLALDVECQERAFAVLRRETPEIPMLGEESNHSRGRSDGREPWQWIVDPIDGTVNFSHGLPFWCSSVALVKGKQTLAGAVFAPVMDELYTATRSSPALLNGRAIHVSSTRTLEDSIVMTSLDRHKTRANILSRAFHRIASTVQRPRILGSAALDVCKVACGNADGYYEGSIFIWDIAAARLVVQRAGGRAETIVSYGGHRLAFMATNGRIHSALRSVVTGTRRPKTHSR